MSRNLLWVGWADEEAHLLVSIYGGRVGDCGGLSSGDDVRVLVLPAHGLPGRRSRRTALQWLQSARRDLGLRGPAVILAFEPRAMLEREFSLLRTGSPGVAFVRLPLADADLESVFASVSPLDDQELAHFIRWHSGLQEIWAEQVHKIGNALTDWPSRRDIAAPVVEELRQSVERYAPDQESAMERLMTALEQSEPGEARVALERLQEGLNGTSPSDFPEAPSERAPAPLLRVLVADDQLPADAPLLSGLKARGYLCRLAQDLSEASRLLSEWNPGVILCDLGFPTPAEGRNLMREALGRHVPVVVAISKAELAPGDIPAGVVDCSGAASATDADKIHRLIWSRAPVGASPVGGSTPAAVARSVDALASLFRFKALQWKKLPDAVSSAADYATRVAGTAGTPDEKVAVASDIADTLTPFRGATLSLDQVKDLAISARRLLERAKSLDGWDTVGSLWNSLHATIDQHVHSAARDITEELAQLEMLQQELESVPAAAAVLARLCVVIERLRAQPLTCAIIQDLAGLTNEAASVLPREAAQPLPLAAPLPTNHFRLVIAEDEEIWTEYLKSVVSLLQEQTQGRYTFTAEFCADAAGALGAVQAEPSAADLEGSGGGVQTIAILDMALPSDAAEAEAIARGEGTPSRQHGHRLVREIRQYRRNVPVVIHTTAPQLLADQLDICSYGVPDCQYLVKDSTQPQRLVDAVLHYVRRSDVHVIEFSLVPYGVTIDGIRIGLGEMPFRTFYVLASLSAGGRQYGYTTEVILLELARLFSDDFEYVKGTDNSWKQAQRLASERGAGCWDSNWLLSAAGAIHLWGAKRRDHPHDLARALTEFRKTASLRVWNNSTRLLDLYRRCHSADPTWRGRAFVVDEMPDWDVIAAAFDRVYGGLVPETQSSYPLENLEKHMNEIRSAVHEEFSRHHAFIEPRHEVLTSSLLNDNLVYRVRGDIRLPLASEEEAATSLSIVLGHTGNSEDDALVVELAGEYLSPGGKEAVEERLCVLVVENEESFSIRIRQLLEVAGFRTVAAANTEDAVLVARAHVPDIICLDMHIPATRADFKQSPSSGDRLNGLRALQQIRELLSDRDVKVMVPTTLYDDDRLRQTAVQLAVPVANFVPKGDLTGDLPWESKLLATANRLREEVLTGLLLPPEKSVSMAVITILSDTDSPKSGVTIQIGQNQRTFRKNQRRLALLLLQRAGQEVTFADIEKAVWNTQPAGRARTQLIKHVRKGFAECAGRDLILTTRDQAGKPQGLLLNACVEDTRGLLWP